MGNYHNIGKFIYGGLIGFPVAWFGALSGSSSIEAVFIGNGRPLSRDGAISYAIQPLLLSAAKITIISCRLLFQRLRRAARPMINVFGSYRPFANCASRNPPMRLFLRHWAIRSFRLLLTFGQNIPIALTMGIAVNMH